VTNSTHADPVENPAGDEPLRIRPSRTRDTLPGRRRTVPPKHSPIVDNATYRERALVEGDVTVAELLRWQWDGYARYHRSRMNLLIHIVAVPLFLMGTVGVVTALVQRSSLMAVVSIAATLVAIALQGRGHKQEQVPPEPFRGPGDAISRIFLEQWVTFPRFVLSGGWVHALREATRT